MGNVFLLTASEATAYCQLNLIMEAKFYQESDVINPLGMVISIVVCILIAFLLGYVLVKFELFFGIQIYNNLFNYL